MSMRDEPMALADHPVTSWARSTSLEPVQIDCATAVMLKILDGKCKMNAAEKVTMEILYDAVKDRPGQLLDADTHQLIAIARGAPDDDLLDKIYERRVLAETAISRPVMKAFKAMLRSKGVLSPK